MIAKTKYFKRGNFRQKPFFYFVCGAAILTAIAFLTYTNLRVSQKKRDLGSQISTLEKEIRSLEEKNEQLKAEISREETESFLEAEARDTLGFKKPGEEVVVVLPPKEGKENPATTTGIWQTLQAEISDFFRNLFGR